MHQTSLDWGRRLRDAGVSRVESNNQSWVERARAIARTIARERGQVTSDDVRDRFDARPAHHNAWGAVFRGAEWTCIGFTQSRRTPAHARTIRVWRLQGD